MILCTKTKTGIELLGVQLSFGGCDYTVAGLAKQEDKNGLLWQYWIILEDTRKDGDSNVQIDNTYT